LDLQADKSFVVVKGPFFPKVWTKGIESMEQCAMQGFNLVWQEHLIFKRLLLHLI
jgi:hypothetical protein